MVCRLSLLGPPRLLDEHGSLVSVPAKTYALVAYLRFGRARGPDQPRLLAAVSLGRVRRQDGRHELAQVPVANRGTTGAVRHRADPQPARPRRAGAWTWRRSIWRRSSAPSPRPPPISWQLCDLYRGDLLEGVRDGRGRSFRTGSARSSTSLRDAFVSAVAGQMEPLDPQTNRVAARVAARRLIDVDPYNEVGHRALMRMFAEESEPARIRDLYRSLDARLQHELAICPDPLTTSSTTRCCRQGRKLEPA